MASSGRAERKAVPLLPAGQDSAWRQRAQCRGTTDDGVWFPRLTASRTSAHRVAAAAALCVCCPVITECTAYAAALPPEQREGIWGGWAQAAPGGNRPGTRRYAPVDILWRCGWTAEPREPPW